MSAFVPASQQDQDRCSLTHEQSESLTPQLQLTRRNIIAMSVLALQIDGLASSPPASALGFTKELKKKPSLEQYSSDETGLKIYDLQVGSGEPVTRDALVKVHYDCMYKSLDVVSSRSARLLGANRSIAEPLEFKAGQEVVAGGKEPTGESAGGLFSGASGPKPPPALSQAVMGMKPGGKRSVIVPPERGYGKQGLLEIPPNATFELQVQLLSVK